MMNLQKQILTLAGLMSLLVGCATQIVDRNQSDLNFWEQGMDTHLRFVLVGHPDEAPIGTLLTDGPNVFVDGHRVSGPFKFRNGSLLETGANSGARLEFLSGAEECRINILDFREGRGYGQSANCRHRIQTPQSESNTHTATAAYRIDTTAQQSVITTYEGTLSVAPRAQPSQIILVNPGEEVVVIAENLIGPRSVTPNQLEQRIRWREQFSFSLTTANGRVIGAAAAAILGGLLLNELLDDYGNNDATRRGEVLDQAPLSVAKPQHQTEYVERYPTIEAQDQVNVDQDFNVLVSLAENLTTPDVYITQVGPDAQKAAEGTLGVKLPTTPEQTYWNIDVLLSAPSFLLGGSDSQTIRLPRYGGDSTPARFKLKAKSIAAEREEKTLYATFWHKGAYLAKVAKTIIVFDLARPNTPATEAGEAAIGAAFGSSAREVRQRLSPPAQSSLQNTVADVGKSPMSFWGQLEPPDLTVWLMRLPDSDDQQLMMLSSPHLQPSTHVIHGPERAQLEQWLQSYYGRFATASRGAQRDGIQPQAPSKEQNIAMLQGFGRELYRRFAPDPFKQAFWSLQDQLGTDFRSIQIFTDDPLLPWELLVPSLPGAGDDSLSRADKYGFLGMDYRLARWHLSQSQSLLQRPPPSIALDTLVVIAPDYLEQPLPHVGDEVRLLRQFSRFQSLPGQFGPIDRFFRTQSLPSGVIHFAGHGIVQTNESGLSEYSIQLEDAELDLMSWRGMVSNQSGGHPLFFFNACDLGQAAHVLNFVDGWAPAVLEAGAGGYIGGLWPLSDKGASEFAQEFYDLIKTDRDATVTIADLLRQTRTHFFESGDPTYLAYVYYGDPNFTLQRLPETGF